MCDSEIVVGDTMRDKDIIIISILAVNKIIFLKCALLLIFLELCMEKRTATKSLKQSLPRYHSEFSTLMSAKRLIFLNDLKLN